MTGSLASIWLIHPAMLTLVHIFMDHWSWLRSTAHRHHDDSYPFWLDSPKQVNDWGPSYTAAFNSSVDLFMLLLSFINEWNCNCIWVIFLRRTLCAKNPLMNRFPWGYGHFSVPSSRSIVTNSNTPMWIVLPANKPLSLTNFVVV